MSCSSRLAEKRAGVFVYKVAKQVTATRVDGRVLLRRQVFQDRNVTFCCFAAVV